MVSPGIRFVPLIALWHMSWDLHLGCSAPGGSVIMGWFPDLFKTLSEKSAFSLATEAWPYDEITKDDDFDIE